MKPKIYLAGPDVFKPNAIKIGEDLKSLLSLHGLIGVFPFDNEVKTFDSKVDTAKSIYNANINSIRDCNGVLANLEPFRGPSTDVGTAFEIGYAVSLGLPVVGYLGNRSSLDRQESNEKFYFGDYSEYKNRVINKLPHDGMSVEDWDLYDNLMIMCATDQRFPSGILDAIKELKKRIGV